MRIDCGSPCVLVMDDDADVLASLERGLRLSGFDVATAKDGAEPLRAMDKEVPVRVLSARSSVDDRVPGLTAGADDYLFKPFTLGELVVRVRALVQGRSPAATSSSEAITVGALEVDIRQRCARVSGVGLDLTRREFEPLAVLAEHTPAVLSRAQLLNLVWGNSHFAA